MSLIFGTVGVFFGFNLLAEATRDLVWVLLGVAGATSITSPKSCAPADRFVDAFVDVAEGGGLRRRRFEDLGVSAIAVVLRSVCCCEDYESNRMMS